MTTLREVAQSLHDKIDNLNVEVGTKEVLCIICKAVSYNGVEGIEHKEECLLARLRRILDDNDDERNYRF